MPQIKLLKQPGYVYDLMFVFYLKYNTEYCMENFVSSQKKAEQQSFYEQILKDFTPLSDDLYVFFHALKNGKCFLSNQYFGRYKKHFINDYNVAFLQNKLSNYSKVVKRLLNFYFYELSAEEIEEYLVSQEKLFDLIKSSEYSFEEKSHLYEFFVNPVSYIQKLQYELLAQEVKLATYYEKHYNRIFDVYNSLSVDILVEQLEPIDDYGFLKDEGQQLYLSFCLLNQLFINCLFTEDAGVALLGINYLDSVVNLQSKQPMVKLDEFGSALGEESRVRMLDFMLEREEITCKDLERTFNFSGSTAYHHLTILLRYGVVKTRNEGKTVLYSVNQTHFDAVVKALKKYTTEGKKTKL